MSKVLKDYIEKLQEFGTYKHPVMVPLNDMDKLDADRFKYIVKVTNKFIADEDFNADELNALINDVSVKIPETHQITEKQLDEFIKLIKIDICSYGDLKFNRIEMN